jgi:hypothetical protein
VRSITAIAAAADDGGGAGEEAVPLGWARTVFKEELDLLIHHKLALASFVDDVIHLVPRLQHISR